jgi:hypothetical protein
MLLGHDWIHANSCMPSLLHQCLIQWVGNGVEVIKANDSACIAMAETQMLIQGGWMKCLIGQDLTEYDYVSVGKDGFVPISVKPMTSATRLIDDML